MLTKGTMWQSAFSCEQPHERQLKCWRRGTKEAKSQASCYYKTILNLPTSQGALLLAITPRGENVLDTMSSSHLQGSSSMLKVRHAGRIPRESKLLLFMKLLSECSSWHKTNWSHSARAGRGKALPNPSRRQAATGPCCSSAPLCLRAPQCCHVPRATFTAGAREVFLSLTQLQIIKDHWFFFLLTGFTVVNLAKTLTTFKFTLALLTIKHFNYLEHLIPYSSSDN